MTVTFWVEPIGEASVSVTARPVTVTPLIVWGAPAAATANALTAGIDVSSRSVS